MAGGGDVPAHGLIGPVEKGWPGILPRGLAYPTTLVVNYAHQLNPLNTLTRGLTKWGLVWALWLFGQDMPP